MSWHNNIDFKRCDRASTSTPRISFSSMNPGLTHTYDHDLREKAGLHMPPPLPEYMGLEGQYDDYGLVRRVAETFDHTPDLAHLTTVTLAQLSGGTIALVGTVADLPTFHRLVAVASSVDGTRAVDTVHLSVL
jgi:hypothetical protein